MSTDTLQPGCQLPEHWPVDSDWTVVVKEFFGTATAQALFEFVSRERDQKQIYPEAECVFRAFECCSFRDTRVVVLGQDPYHAAGQAHGLCFSVPDGVKPPPSLRNIFKELQSDLGIDNHEKSDLTPWAGQGVLLLNTVLTVESGRANSHRHRGWEELTDLVIEKLGHRKKPVVFVLWGKPASRKAELISDRHVIVTSAHPSPLSAYRGFFGSQPFSTINNCLTKNGGPVIDWQL